MTKEGEIGKLDEVLKTGKNQFSQIDQQRLAEEQRLEQQGQRKLEEIEKKKQQKINNERNYRYLTESSAKPLLQRINSEVLDNEGVILDWVLKHREIHWDFERREVSDGGDPSDGFHTASNFYPHEYSSIDSAILLPNKGLVICSLVLEEQFGHNFDSEDGYEFDNKRNLPYKFRLNWLSKRKKVYQEFGWSDHLRGRRHYDPGLDYLHRLVIYSSRKPGLFGSLQRLCYRNDSAFINNFLTSEEETLNLDWTKSIKKLQEIY